MSRLIMSGFWCHNNNVSNYSLQFWEFYIKQYWQEIRIDWFSNIVKSSNIRMKTLAGIENCLLIIADVGGHYYYRVSGAINQRVSCYSKQSSFLHHHHHLIISSFLLMTSSCGQTFSAISAINNSQNILQTTPDYLTS